VLPSNLGQVEVWHVLFAVNNETFCEAESAIKTYLKILANLLHSAKHAVYKVEKILWYNKEHSMYCTMIVVTLAVHSQ